jgi:hypothetical protein
MKLKPGKPVKGKHGEPTDWDGLSTVFLVLARQNPSVLMQMSLSPSTPPPGRSSSWRSP